MTNSEISRKYSISKGHVTNINREKDQIKAYATVGNLNMSKKLFVKNKLIDQEVIRFVFRMRQQRLPLTKGLIQKYAQQCATLHGNIPFKASTECCMRSCDEIAFNVLSNYTALVQMYALQSSMRTCMYHESWSKRLIPIVCITKMRLAAIIRVSIAFILDFYWASKECEKYTSHVMWK